MENLDQQPAANQPESPTSTPPQPAAQQIQKRPPFNLTALFVGMFVLVLIGSIATASYVAGRNESRQKEQELQWKVDELKDEVDTLTNQIEASRNRPNLNIQTPQPIDLTLDLELKFLSTYRMQNGQYPSTPTEDMKKLAEVNYYAFKVGSSVVSCPAESRYFSYSTAIGQKTGLRDTFTLYYCDGSQMLKKTQADA